jgi:predicted RNase H-like HicB family nuclease
LAGGYGCGGGGVDRGIVEYNQRKDDPMPHDTLVIHVEYNTEDEEYGAVYIATNRDLHLVADGQTFEELLDNLRDAIAACLDDTDTVAAFNLVPNPRIEIKYN